MFPSTRNFIEHGFNIKNRRALKALVGEEEYKKLVELSKQLINPTNLNSPELNKIDLSGGGYTQLGYWQGQLNLKIKPYINDFGINTPYNSVQIFRGEEIKENVIKDRLTKFVKKAAENQKSPIVKDESFLETSPTLNKLYSPEFKVPQGMNEDGYYVTSVIDKETNKPVNAYVKLIEKNEDPIAKDKNTKEKWGIFLKNSNGEYVLFGNRSFGINRNIRKITSGNMNSQIGISNQYAGIGLRAHQIALERMLQEGLDSIEIYSLEQAFPFHYKAGFRIDNYTRSVSEREFNKYINNLVDGTGYPRYEILKIVPRKEVDGMIEVSTQSLEDVQKKLFLETGRTFTDEDMHLPEDKMSEWIERIKSQPILIPER